MNRKLVTLLASSLAAALLLVSGAIPVSAHHSFSAEFDGSKDKQLVLAGRVAKMEWVNPHAWLYIDVDRNGKTERWAVEFGSPNVLFRNGWKKDSLPEGMRVIVQASPAKDGSLRANSRGVEFPDGRKLDTGSSAGKDGKDAK
ncbi:MAG: DUF6152 family protein [Bryobacteraceae bacterium]